MDLNEFKSDKLHWEKAASSCELLYLIFYRKLKITSLHWSVNS